MNLKQISLIAGLAASAIVVNGNFSQVLAADLIINGSFENTSDTFTDNGQGGQSLPVNSTVIPGWTTTNAELAWLVNGNAYGLSTPFGSYFLDLTGYHDASPYGGVTQTINTTIGQSYTLSLSVGVDNSNGLYEGPVSVQATAGSISQSFTNNLSAAGNQWEDFSLNFTASSTSTPITILGISTQGGQYIGLDNVSVVPTSSVPEPLTILGSITALGLGASIKRLRRST